MTVKEFILKETDCRSIDQLKQKLFRAKKFQYGCYYSEIKCKSFRAFYTGNDNHFCNYGFSFNGIGMSATYGMDYSCITKAGKLRGCELHYVSDKFLNSVYNAPKTKAHEKV